MLIRRRSFVLGTAFAASAAPLASLLIAPVAQAMPAVRSKLAAKAAEAGPAALKIHGWDEAQGDDHAWISVNQGWRGAWR